MYRNYWYEELVSKWEKYLYPDRPESATMGGWREYRDKQKETPVRYFFASTLPSFIEKVAFYVPSKIHDLKWFIWYRFAPKYRYFMIDTKLEPGYYDCDTRMLHGMFEMLVDFVECEKAWMQRGAFGGSDGEQKVSFIERWNLRDPEAGLRYLDWEIGLADPKLKDSDDGDSYVPHQAEAAREIKSLYTWWKFIRPERRDPHDESGWSKYCEGRDLWSDTKPEDEARVKEMLAKTQEIETQYNNQDEENLIRLIKIRHQMWT